MKKHFTLIGSAFVAVVLLVACKREYIVGGDVHDVNMYKNVSTYDVLKKFPEYDTLVQLIDAGNLQEAINQNNSTFFAVNNRSIFAYLNARTIFLQNTVDQNKKFLLDSLIYYIKNNINNTRDSLLMYLVPNLQVNPDGVTQIGNIYPSALNGSRIIVSFEETVTANDGYYSNISTIPRLLYFTQLWKPYQIGQDSTAAAVPPATGIRTRVKTSFINTQNGVLNALNTATLFYYGQRVN
ncbi:hypothetical protein ABDK00_009485 [Niabella insulamsoli]|uniref:hypothetical protein n=1 Tax=Niabella insulamsoli TaxID=3144874 RepID=UPI0031FBBB3D